MQKNNREGFTCVVTLSQTRSSTKETVVMQPYPPLSLPTSLEAKHWGATYALYRFSNNLQLHRLLPPGPREYWAELEKDHKTCPDHLKWQYEADPFAAKRMVEQRQEVASRKKIAEQATGHLQDHSRSKEYEKAPEVRMASSMRERVEDVVKEVLSSQPDSCFAIHHSMVDGDSLPWRHW
jgi:ATP-dependent RNA helicase DHX57